MLITTIERESSDDDLFSKSAAILTAASEVAYHTMNTSALNAEELRRDNGIPVSGEGVWHGERRGIEEAYQVKGRERAGEGGREGGGGRAGEGGGGRAGEGGREGGREGE